MFDDSGSFLLALFEFFIFFAWIMCVFYVFADIFRSHDMGGGAKTVWCLFVIFVPFLGVLVYLIARGGGMTERTMEQQQRMQDQQAEYVRSVVATSGSGSSADQIASAKQLLCTRPRWTCRPLAANGQPARSESGLAIGTWVVPK